MTGAVTCPTCGANNPAGATWCSLCHTSFLKPESELKPEPAPEPLPGPASAEESEPPRAAVPPQSRGEPTLDPDQWVALLAAEEARRPSRFEAAMTRRSARVLFAVAVIGSVLVVALVGMLLLSRLAE